MTVIVFVYYVWNNLELCRGDPRNPPLIRCARFYRVFKSLRPGTARSSFTRCARSARLLQKVRNYYSWLHPVLTTRLTHSIHFAPSSLVACAVHLHQQDQRAAELRRHGVVGDDEFEQRVVAP